MVRTLTGTAQSPSKAIRAYSRKIKGDIEVQSLLPKYEALHMNMGIIARHEEALAKRSKAQGIQIDSLKAELKN